MNILLGLILVPNGKLIGKKLGDKYPYEDALAKAKLEQAQQEEFENMQEPNSPGGRLSGSDYEYHKTMAEIYSNNSKNIDPDEEYGDPTVKSDEFDHENHPWGIFFTVLGTVLLDFDADACQSPSRAYLLDVTVSGIKTSSGHFSLVHSMDISRTFFLGYSKHLFCTFQRIMQLAFPRLQLWQD